MKKPKCDIIVDLSNQPPTKIFKERFGKKLTPHLGGALDKVQYFSATTRRLSLVFLACRT